MLHISAFVRLRHAKATAHGAVALTAQAVIGTDNVVSVRLSDAAGAVASGRITVTVY